MISRQGEFRTPLAPNGKPFLIDHSVDVGLSSERLFINRTLKKEI